MQAIKLNLLETLRNTGAAVVRIEKRHPNVLNEDDARDEIRTLRDRLDQVLERTES